MVRKFELAAAATAGIYLMVIAALWTFQRALIYSPDEAYVPPGHYAMLDGVDEIVVDTADGIALTAWYTPAPPGRPTVVILPGKSGSLHHQRYRLERFMQARIGALLVAYRGYSGNAGRPDEQGLYRDARAALDWLDRHGVAARSIVVYGISLGTGVAVRMATERAVGAMVLEAPYTSITDVAAGRYPFVPVRWLLRDRFDSLARIGEVSEPLLIMHGAADRVVPQALGRTLYAHAGAPKESFWPTEAGHSDIFDRGGFERALGFIARSTGTSATGLVAADQAKVMTTPSSVRSATP